MGVNEYTCRLVYKKHRDRGLPETALKVLPDGTCIECSVPGNLVVANVCFLEVTQRPVLLGNTINNHNDWIYVLRDGQIVKLGRLKFLQARWYFEIDTASKSNKEGFGKIEVIFLQHKQGENPLLHRLNGGKDLPHISCKGRYTFVYSTICKSALSCHDIFCLVNVNLH